MAFGLREYFAIRIAAGTMKRKVIAAMTPWPLIIWWYWGSEANLLPIPIHCTSTSASIPSIVSVLQMGREGKEREGREDNKPLYLIVSKFKPTRFGSRKSLRVASHVPSPTYMVFELYVLLPGGERLSWGAIVAAKELCSGAHPLQPAAAPVNSLFGPLDRTMYCVKCAMSGLLSIAVGMRSVGRNGCSSRAPSGVCCQSRLSVEPKR